MLIVLRRPFLYGGIVHMSIVMHLHTTELVLFVISVTVRKYYGLTCAYARICLYLRV